VKEIIEGDDSDKRKLYEQLVQTVKELQRSVLDDVASQIEQIQNQLSSVISEIFPGYTVIFDARTEDNIDGPVKAIFTLSVNCCGGSERRHVTILETGN